MNRQTVEKVEEKLQLVCFRLGEVLYGLDIHSLQEIVKMHPVTKLPKALPFVEGVVKLRDLIVPVIDLAKHFGLPPVSPGRQTRIILARLAGQSVGLIVDRVEEVIQIETEAVEPAPQMAFDIDHKYVQGMGRVEEGLIIILNLSGLLSNEEMTQLRQQTLL